MNIIVIEVQGKRFHFQIRIHQVAAQLHLVVEVQLGDSQQVPIRFLLHPIEGSHHHGLLLQIPFVFPGSAPNVPSEITLISHSVNSVI